MSVYTSLSSGNDNAQHQRPGIQDENERLVAAFNDDSDSESEDNQIEWAVDRNITMHSGPSPGQRPTGAFVIADEEDEDPGTAQGFRNNQNGSGFNLFGHNNSGSSMATSSTAVATGTPSSSLPSGLRGLAGILFRHHSHHVAPVESENDGVFSNLSARPETGSGSGPGGGPGGATSGDEDKPPTYEEAAADATPPYWETTIMTPGMGDELFIDGLPVGSPINFVWNMMVSAAFQFVGFFLTYLLHTSHASKQGSRAGLGFTLVQCGYYLLPDDEDFGDTPVMPPIEVNPDDPNDIGDGGYGSGMSTYVDSAAAGSTATYGGASGSSYGSGSSVSWMSTLLMVVGALIILKSVADYMEACRMEKAILSSNGTGEVVEGSEEDHEEEQV